MVFKTCKNCVYFINNECEKWDLSKKPWYIKFLEILFAMKHPMACDDFCFWR